MSFGQLWKSDEAEEPRWIYTDEEGKDHDIVHCIDALETCLDALDHIQKTARNGTTFTRRLKWIKARAMSAINGDDSWRDYDIPRNRRKQRVNHRLRLRKALQLLKVAECPDQDCDEGIVHRDGEWHQCQWCDELDTLLNPEGDGS